MAPFVNRELSWLDFNHRVLAEAKKEENPLMDRLEFLSITASNLDEFYMVRMAYLHDRAKTSSLPDDSGLTPQEQLSQVLSRAKRFQADQSRCFARIKEDLAAEGIRFATMDSLTPAQHAFSRELFHEEILPVVTPLAVDPARPFPFLANKSLNIGVRLRGSRGENRYAVVQVPSILPRFVQLPHESEALYLPMEELIAHFLPAVCDLYQIEAYGCFRITRSADFDADEDTDDLLEEMRRTLRKRKRGRPIRLELTRGFDRPLGQFIEKTLGIHPRYVLYTASPLDLTALHRIARAEEHAALRRPPLHPVTAGDFAGQRDLFAAIRERDRLVHHPYQTFDHVVDLLFAAAGDPTVLAIKQVLYRVSGKSQVIAALEQAAEMGKQVTVLVELKARFDEENNIHWAKRLERAGCHVIYGLTGLKTHCKITLIVRREPEGIRRYVHLGTGNYNDATARQYTDIGMFSCRPELGADASALFNHLTGFSAPPAYSRLIAAPESMSGWFLAMVDREIESAKKNLPCGISIKTNSLLDRAIIEKLYEASQAGVPIRLLVRGICGLVPQIPGFSENIRVRSIVGQLLEHSRIFTFAGGGKPLVFLGSADLMPRNLHKRVEVIFPVEEPVLKQRLTAALELMWRDNTNAWECGRDGKYRPVKKRQPPVTAQTELARAALEELYEAQRQL